MTFYKKNVFRACVCAKKVVPLSPNGDGASSKAA